MRVLVDIDGTLNEFTKPFIARVRELGYDFDESSYSWELADAISADNPKEVVNKIFSDISFWENLKPRPYTYNALSYINDRHEVIIATIPWRQTPAYKESKIAWMGYYFPFIDRKQISFQRDKWNIPGDVIIDDKPDTILKSMDVGKITLVPKMPYNQDIDADVFFSSWKEIPKLFEKIGQIMEELRMT